MAEAQVASIVARHHGGLVDDWDDLVLCAPPTDERCVTGGGPGSDYIQGTTRWIKMVSKLRALHDDLAAIEASIPDDLWPLASETIDVAAEILALDARVEELRCTDFEFMQGPVECDEIFAATTRIGDANPLDRFAEVLAAWKPYID